MAEPPSQPASRPCRAGAFLRTPTAAAIAVALLTAAAYWNSFRGAFVFDDSNIPENRTIRRLWPVWEALSPPRGGAPVEGRPVVNLSLAVNYAISGLNIWSYHLLNLAVHVLAALTLLGVVRRTLILPGLRGRYAGAATPLALAVALLWAVHPLQTESVTYVSQRAESIVGLFYLLTLYCAIRGAVPRRPAGSHRALWWYAAAVAACLLGMASKEIMVSAPLIVLLYDRVFLWRSFREAFRRRWGLYVALAATWALLAFLVLKTEGRSGAAGFGFGMSSWDYAKTQFRNVVHYLRLCFWPDPLILDYGIDVAEGASQIVPPAIVVGLLAAGTAAAFRYRPWIGLVGTWFFAILAPTSSIIPLLKQTAAEHRMYLPLAAVVVLVVMGAYRGWGLLLARVPALRRGRAALSWIVPVGVLAGVVTAFVYRTVLRNADYRSEASIYRVTVRDCWRNHRAHVNLGDELLAAGDITGALEEYGVAIQLSPRYAPYYVSRALAYQRAGRYEEAVQDCIKAIGLQPDSTDAYSNLGNARMSLGQYRQALEDFTKAIDLGSKEAWAYSNRGNAYKQLQEFDLALRDYGKAVELDPNLAEAYNNRGEAYRDMNRFSEAIEDFNRAIQLQPDYADPYFGRALVHQQANRYDQAIADYGEVIRLRPDFGGGYFNRALVCQLSGRYAQAAADYTRAIELKPEEPLPYFNRAVCHYFLKQYDRAWADIKTFRNLGGRPNPKFILDLTRASGRSQ